MSPASQHVSTHLHRGEPMQARDWDEEAGQEARSDEVDEPLTSTHEDHRSKIKGQLNGTAHLEGLGSSRHP